MNEEEQTNGIHRESILDLDNQHNTIYYDTLNPNLFRKFAH